MSAISLTAATTEAISRAADAIEMDAAHGADAAAEFGTPQRSASSAGEFALAVPVAVKTADFAVSAQCRRADVRGVASGHADEAVAALPPGVQDDFLAAHQPGQCRVADHDPSHLLKPGASSRNSRMILPTMWVVISSMDWGC